MSNLPVARFDQRGRVLDIGGGRERSGTTVIVAPARTDCGDAAMKAACDINTGFRPQGGATPASPMNSTCDPEMSSWIMEGAAPLGSVYTSVPTTLIKTNVPNDNLGVVANLRGVLDGIKSLGVGDQEDYLAAPATSVTLTMLNDVDVLAAGVFVYLNLGVALAQASVLRVVTSGFASLVGGADVDRAVTVRMLQASAVFAMFLPFAANQRAAADAAGAELWGPVGGVSDSSGPATITIIGAPDPSSGSVVASAVGPYSSHWAEIRSMMRSAILPG